MGSGFSKYVGDTWGISQNAASLLCSHFNNGYSIYFLKEYIPELSILGVDKIAEIYDFLNRQKELEPLRQQARDILKAAGKYDDVIEGNLSVSVSEWEIEDIIAAYKINHRTKGSIAKSKGLDALADLFFGEYYGDVDEEAEKYVDEAKGLKDTDDVLNGVVSILAERFAANEYIRFDLRSLTEQEGNIEVVALDKTTNKYAQFVGVYEYNKGISNEDLCFLRQAEKNKEVKILVSAPVLYALEMLKSQFLLYENSTSAGIINRAISEAWLKHLSPMVQEAVKQDLYDKAISAVSHTISEQIREVFAGKIKSEHHKILIISQNSEMKIDIISVDNDGSFLRASSENVRQYGRAFNSTKIKNAITEWRSDEFLIVENPKYIDFLNEVIGMTLVPFSRKPVISRTPLNKKVPALLNNNFIKEQMKIYDEENKNVYLAAMSKMAPINLCYDPELLKTVIDNSAVSWIGAEKLNEIIDRNLTLLRLEQGVEIGEKHDDLLLKLGVSSQSLFNMRSAKKYGTLRCKTDLRKIDGVDKIVYHNIAGFVIFPKAQGVLDRTLVHPVMFHLAYSVSELIDVALEDIIRDETILVNYNGDDTVDEMFIRDNLAKHLHIGAKYLSMSGSTRARTTLQDVVIGTVTYGKVRNITDFGIFVDINAVIDGLVHISEVPYDLVATIDESVKIGERVRVKILDVDAKRRKIALTMIFKQEGITQLLKQVNNKLLA